MAFSRTAQAVLFSVGVHSLLFGAGLIVAGDQHKGEEKVYRVALAQLAAPTSPIPEELPPPPVEVPPEPPKIEPKEPPKEPPKEQTRKISPKKKPDAPKKEAPTSAPPPPPPPAPSGPVARNVGGISAYDSDKIDQRPFITRSASPSYPSVARRMNIEGRVLVQVVVDTRGQPRNERILKATPAGYFEESSLQAVRKMRFSPGRLKGQVVNTLVVIPIEFKLH